MVRADGKRNFGLVRLIHLRRFAEFAMVATMCAGCTSLQTSPLPPDALRAGIRAGELIEPGEDVWITTVDGSEHAFEVTALEPDRIRGRLLGGESVEVSVDDVAALRTVGLEAMPTFFAGVGIYYLAAITISIAIVADDL